jgi:putative oxidoreductase
MIAFARKLNTMIDPPRHIADKVVAPLLDLTIRLFMANIFFKSGWLKFQKLLNHDWGSTVYLFQDIHPVPGISAGITEIMGTTSELVLPVLPALGLFARVGAAGMLIMKFVFQFVVPAEYGIATPVHYYWMMLLGVIFVKGPGALSLDYLLVRWLRKKATVR